LPFTRNAVAFTLLTAPPAPAPDPEFGDPAAAGYHLHPVRRVGGTGRRDGLKNRCPKGRVGSSPTLGTKVGRYFDSRPFPDSRGPPQLGGGLVLLRSGRPDSSRSNVPGTQ